MKELLQEIRAKAESMPREDTLIGWFTREVDQIGSSFLARISDVFVVMLSWDLDHVYRAFKHPLTMVVAPAIWHKSRAYIGGLGWKRLGVWPQRVQYLPPVPHLPAEEQRKGAPVGWFYVIFDESGGLFSPDEKKGTVLHRAFEAALDLLNWDQESQLLGDRQITMPTLLSCRTPQAYLHLRPSSVLDHQVLHCAYSGIWQAPIHSFTSTFRGTAFATEKQVDLTPEGATAPTESFERCDAESALELAIRNDFGEVVAVQLQSVFPLRKPAHVQLGQPLFRPIEKKNWTIEELKSRPDWPTLVHMAALSMASPYAGHTLYDADLVESETEPWVDMRRSAPRSKVRNRPAALFEETPAGVIDLQNVPLRRIAHQRLSPRRG